jgi:rhodanese-related sulfurtransferase
MTMPLRRVSAGEAAALIEREGYRYLDVRSVPEFEAGHPQGAYNIPLAHMGPFGMAPNGDFLAQVERHFPKDARLVVGCKSGGRSLQAVTLLLTSGYAQVVDQRCGFDGVPGGPGWRACGLPSAERAEAGRSFAELSAPQP